MILDTLKAKLSPDRFLQSATEAAIEAVALRYALQRHPRQWKRGQPLKLIFSGYAGSRNTGADVRVAEMIRQIRSILGEDSVEMTVMTTNTSLTEGYFSGTRQVTLPTLFPKFLYDECPKHDGVIACEGSMFKSRFANALSVMMAGSLGVASAEDKLCVGYGGEAGKMDPVLKDFVAKHCRNAYILCRNNESENVLARLGLRTGPGADTAWTFDPGQSSYARTQLERSGWDGQKPILTLCPINPFWWPVRPDLGKSAVDLVSDLHTTENYTSIYYHQYDNDDREKFTTYTDNIATAVRSFKEDHDIFPVLIGMEKLDRSACERVAELVGDETPVFVSDEYNMYDLVSILRQSSYLVSSRFHAIVLSMSAGVVSAGITMDERIRNLMNGRHHQAYLMNVDDIDLSERLLATLRSMKQNYQQLQDETLRAVPGQIKSMGEMGRRFVNEVTSHYPDFVPAKRDGPWESFLPSLTPALESLLTDYGDTL